MNGTELIKSLKTVFGVRSRGQIGKHLGQSYTVIANWTKKDLSPTQIARIIQRAREAGYKAGKSDAIKLQRDKKRSELPPIAAIIEYLPIKAHKTPSSRVRVAINDDYKDPNIRSTIKDKHGIYIFYDSLGKPLYIGKANKTDFWNEVNSAFRRLEIKIPIVRVNHTLLNRNTTNHKLRSHNARISDVACYLSVYEVRKDLIDNMEAMLIRSSANVLANTRMESIRKTRTGA